MKEQKSIEREHDDPWRCTECGSKNVQERVWRSVNDIKNVDAENCDRNDYFCENCENHIRLERESVLMEQAAQWWGETDFRAMERITSYRQLDFDPEEGYRAFVDACNKWWNEKTIEEKISTCLDVIKS